MKVKKHTEQLSLKGRVKIILESEEGKRVYEYDNLIVNAGANLLRDFLKGDSVSGITHIAFGDGTSSPVASDTQLENELYRQEITDIAVDNRFVKFIVFVPSSAFAGTISELGLFGNGATDSANSGTLFSRVVISPINKSDTESLTVEWTITL